MILSRRSLLAAAGLGLPAALLLPVVSASAAVPKRLPGHAKHATHASKSHTHAAKHVAAHRKLHHAAASNTGASAAPAKPPSDT